jgi:hypothetical protein
VKRATWGEIAWGLSEKQNSVGLLENIRGASLGLLLTNMP